MNGSLRRLSTENLLLAANYQRELERAYRILMDAPSAEIFDLTAKHNGWTDLVGSFHLRKQLLEDHALPLINGLKDARVFSITPSENYDWPINPSAQTTRVLQGKFLDMLTWSYPGLRAKLPLQYAYGWYWHLTEDVLFLIDALEHRRIRFNVWDTHQFKAVERLIGTEYQNFPSANTSELEQIFVSIAALELICGYSRPYGEVQEAITELKNASKTLVKVANNLARISPEIFEIIEMVPGPSSRSVDEINHFSSGYSASLGSAIGTLTTHLDSRRKIHEKFCGKPTKVGSPSNWVSEQVAICAASIYRLLFDSKVERTKKGSGRGSFVTFLRDFSKGYPEAEQADHRKLARTIWNS